MSTINPLISALSPLPRVSTVELFHSLQIITDEVIVSGISTVLCYVCTHLVANIPRKCNRDMSEHHVGLQIQSIAELKNIHVGCWAYEAN